jgi:hypothetical protein
MKFKLIILLTLFLGILSFKNSYAQELNLRSRKSNALGGKAFALSISDSTLTLEKREELIFKEIKSGNVPNFLRKFKEIKQSSGDDTEAIRTIIVYYVLPDYFAIGSDDDFFYVPMTPILAQKIADLIKCSLPTKKMVDTIYKNATIKLAPKPIPPTKAMTTVPIFILHGDSVKTQLIPFQNQHLNGELTGGNKKDIIISNKIYTEKTAKVVIYGWHKTNGLAIQPVYNKHTNLWADYSHGVRFVLQKATIIVKGQKEETTIKKTLSSKINYYLLSDEGVIEKSFYPITGY